MYLGPDFTLIAYSEAKVYVSAINTRQRGIFSGYTQASSSFRREWGFLILWQKEPMGCTCWGAFVEVKQADCPGV